MTTMPPTTTASSEYVARFPAVIPATAVFLKDLDSVYYLNNKDEANLVCSVLSGDQVTYRCNNNRLPEDQLVSLLLLFLFFLMNE
jgi:hypothetical protein